MRRSLLKLNGRHLPKALRQALVLLTMLLLPSAAWGETVTKTITFNKTTAIVTSSINGSSLSVSVTEQVGSGTPVSYDGTVNILDALSQLSQYSCSENGGAVFTLGSQADVNKGFTIEIPGIYPTVPSQVTLTVAYEGSSVTGNNNKIQVGDYGNANQVAPVEGDDVVDFYNYYHPYRSSNTSLAETTLTYTGNNKSGLGTNRDDEGSQCIYVYLAANATFTIKEATITYETDVYGLSVAGIPVTGVNANDVLGDGTVSFTPANNTLTLSNAEITVNGKNAIESGLDNLTVNLVENGNVITCQGSTDCVFKGTTSGATVTFTTNNSDPGSLTGSVSQESNMFNGITPDYQNGLVYSREGYNFFIKIAEYGLSIGGEEITTANVDANGNITGITSINNGTAKFTPANNTTTPATPATLTLNGATITGGIYTTLDNLTIELTDNSSIDVSAAGNINGIASSENTGTLTFTGSGSLEITSGASVIRGFSELSLSSGLYSQSDPYEIYEDAGYKRLRKYTGSEADTTAITSFAISTAVTYPLWVGGTQVTAENASSVTGTNITGDVSFTSENSILLLNGTTISTNNEDRKPIILSGLDKLVIQLRGENTFNIGASYGYYMVASTNPSAKLTFTASGDDASISSDISSTTYTGASAVGFASISYEDGLLYYDFSGSQYIKIVEPTITSSNIYIPAVTGSVLQSTLTLFYSVDYADEAIADIKNATVDFDNNTTDYSFDINLTQPSVVTAYVTYRGYAGKETTAKYFEFSEAGRLALFSGTEKELTDLPTTLVPAIGEDDGVTLEFTSSTEPTVIDNDGSKWMVKGTGATFLEATITPSATTPYTILTNEGLGIYVQVLEEPAFEANYDNDPTDQYDGEGAGDVYVTFSNSDSYSESNGVMGCTLMYYLGTDKSKAEAYNSEIVLDETTTVNAFIRYTNSDDESITYDSETVSKTYKVNQLLNIPSFEGSVVFQTCYSDYSLQVPDGLKAYTITGVSEANHSVVATEIEYIPKEVPVLLEKVGNMPAGGWVAETYTGEEGNFSGNKLYYVDEQYSSINATGNEYILYNNEFVRATGTIAQGKCYLGLNGEATSGNLAFSRGFTIDTGGEGTTGLGTTPMDNGKLIMDNYFDLQGRRIKKPTKAGLYIVNGKKVVVNNK